MFVHCKVLSLLLVLEEGETKRFSSKSLHVTVQILQISQVKEEIYCSTVEIRKAFEVKVVSRHTTYNQICRFLGLVKMRKRIAEIQY